MKTRISLLLAALCLSSALFAQPSQERRDRLEAAKVAFISHEVGLTSEEAKVFWPVYDAYQAELRSIEKDPLHEIMKAKRDPKSLSDADALQLLKDLERTAEKREAIRKAYQKKFLDILPAHKVVAYLLAEKEFQRKLREKLEEGRQGGPGRPGPGGQGGRPGGRPGVHPGAPPALF